MRPVLSVSAEAVQGFRKALDVYNLSFDAELLSKVYEGDVDMFQTLLASLVIFADGVPQPEGSKHAQRRAVSAAVEEFNLKQPPLPPPAAAGPSCKKEAFMPIQDLTLTVRRQGRWLQDLW